MWYFLGLAVFKVELLAPEVGSNFKKKNDGKAVLKKKSRPQFLDFNPEIESRPQKYIYLGRDSISGSKSKNCGRDFFFDTSYLRGRFQFCRHVPTLSSNNSR